MKVVNITYVMIKLQFKLPQALISRGFTGRTVFHAPAFQQKGINRLMDTLKQTLLELQNKMNGALIRSKEKLIEEGEKPTKYFFFQEQMKQKNALHRYLFAYRRTQPN